MQPEEQTDPRDEKGRFLPTTQPAPPEIIHIGDTLLLITPAGHRPAVVEHVHDDGRLDATVFEQGTTRSLQRAEVAPVLAEATFGQLARRPWVKG